ncbi:MAG: glutamine--fructose-6-phosphate transaminase (isomerizing) [Pseudomonadota bacterium]
MCGIVGIVGKDPVADDIMSALRRLEYRGYDSAGIATLEDGTLTRRRAAGKLDNLARVLTDGPLSGTTGIGHTRWATHGKPTEHNAHPHASGRVAVVHNGIIENFASLRQELVAEGRNFESETDTETVAHLVDREMKAGASPEDAVAAILPRLEGAFSLAFVFDGTPGLMVAARRGSPLAIGLGEGANYLGSDAIALSLLTDRVIYLEEGDWAVVRTDSVDIRDTAGRPVDRPVHHTPGAHFVVDKCNFRHFMAKEIHEQPEVLSRTLGHYIVMADQAVRLPMDVPFDWTKLSRITISACGTAFYAGMIGKYWFERFARLPVEIDIASEFRYREAPLAEDGLAIFVSQSGETADTLAALRYCKEHGQHIAAIVNVPTSTIARESDIVLPILAGPEIGVASTKAFTCQLAVLACLAIAAGRARGTIDATDEARLVAALVGAPRLMVEALKLEDQTEALARDLSKAEDVLYLGRGTNYPLALEGALKLKEISYIHAEGYAAGELKHGPIALIDETLPVIIVAPFDRVFDKTVSNMQEVQARGGRIILITDQKGADAAGDGAIETVILPDMAATVAPLVYALPMQLLAYHTAVFMGTDVDQPRNLAKSVTVE